MHSSRKPPASPLLPNRQSKSESKQRHLPRQGHVDLRTRSLHLLLSFILRSVQEKGGCTVLHVVLAKSCCEKTLPMPCASCQSPSIILELIRTSGPYKSRCILEAFSARNRAKIGSMTLRPSRRGNGISNHLSAGWYVLGLCFAYVYCLTLFSFFP